MQTARQVLQTLSERSRAPLYHGTSYLALLFIYATDALTAQEASSFDTRPGVSLSRSLVAARSFGPVVLVLDQDQLRRHYRVRPADFWAERTDRFGDFRGPTAPKMVRAYHDHRLDVGSGVRQPPYEAEERVYDTIRPLRRYL